MRFSEIKQDKGVAGLSILLSLVVMMFIIGLIVMIFTLMGAGMKDSTYLTTLITVSDEYVEGSTSINDTPYELGAGVPQALRGSTSYVITGALNSSSNLVIIVDGNVTVNATGWVTNASSINWNNVTLNYTYTWEADTIATDVMNDTTSAIAGVTSWFSIFIVIGAMVVLILLTVIIITAIRGSGMIEGEGTSRTSNVGSA